LRGVSGTVTIIIHITALFVNGFVHTSIIDTNADVVLQKHGIKGSRFYHFETTFGSEYATIISL